MMSSILSNNNRRGGENGSVMGDTRSIHSNATSQNGGPRTINSAASYGSTTKSQMTSPSFTSSHNDRSTDEAASTTGAPPQSQSVSFLSRVTAEMGNAMSDAYGHLIYGDDAGKSARLVYIARPRPVPPSIAGGQSLSKFDLGMTFLEVNGRAYVRTISPESDAAHVGVQPRDAVQFAVVLGGPNLDEISDNRKRGNEEKVKTFALECERRGMRTTYDELRDMFYDCCVSSSSSGANHINGENGEGGEEVSFDTFESPPTSPTNSTKRAVSRTVARATQKAVGTCTSRSPSHSSLPTSADVDGAPSTPSNSDGAALYPVALVFRRTRKRRVGIGGLAHLPGFPTYRLDDECDRAASLIRRLAPTPDTMPQPDAWDELVHDGTEWLMGPPLSDLEKDSRSVEEDEKEQMMSSRSFQREVEETNTIPLDPIEQRSTVKLKELQHRMKASSAPASNPSSPSSQHAPENDDVEASTIRSMIQRAVGLAFIRFSKIVLGVSVHAGSGIVVSRLPDGTWSAPSAIGSWGLGLGIQFGLEVADFIFILQTEDSLEHFRRGGHFTIGGNVGAAVAGLGREAYGAASVGFCGKDTTPPLIKDDDLSLDADDNDKNRTQPKKKKTSEIAPIVAYAKSQGLYFGVSLEGSRIFTREDINARTYKFATGKAVPARDILGGKVPTPVEAEDLYASLHSVEFTHEISNLPHPPELLRKDLMNAWCFDSSILTEATSGGRSVPPFSFLSNITNEQSGEFAEFETKFKKFLYGGVSVQRLLPNVRSNNGEAKRERRTLWLMLPEVGALRLGFISKNDRERGASKIRGNRMSRDDFSEYSGSIGTMDDYSTVYSDDYTNEDTTLGGSTVGGSTIDGTVRTNGHEGTDASGRRKLTDNVNLSEKYCLALTDVTILSQDPNVSIPTTSNGRTEHLRLISIQDASGTSLLFFANNSRETELLVCGLKLLLERETSRLGVRGGVPITQLGGSVGAGAMSPSSARGFHREEPLPMQSRTQSHSPDGGRPQHRDLGTYGKGSGYESSDNEGDGDILFVKYGSSISPRHHVPEGRKSWSEVPSRNHLRDVASRSSTPINDDNGGPTRPFDRPQSETIRQETIPNYVHGQLLIRDIATNVDLPLPLPLCRVLLLDSTSPVITKWETDRGDTNYSKNSWIFPPATPREREHHTSEHQLIASGSMMGAHRATSYDRIRNGEVVRLSETQIVDADDAKKLAFTVTERMPRRGFSVKMRILLRSAADDCCEATILGEFRPMGKNMSNQLAVHKAFLLVLDEVKMRYGTEGRGLLAGFVNVINNFPGPETTLPPRDVIISSSMVPQRTLPESPPERSEEKNQTKEPLQHQQRSTPSTDPIMPKTRGLMVDTNIPKRSHGIIQPPSQKDPNSSSTKSSQDHVKPTKVLRPRERESRRSNSSRDSSNRDKDKWRDRPPTPSMLRINNNEPSKPKQTKISSKDFADMPGDEYGTSDVKQRSIEVKPLPKIRLSLMPSPREEDEENESAGTPTHSDMKKHRSRSRRNGSRKSGSSRKSRHEASHRV